MPDAFDLFKVCLYSKKTKRIHTCCKSPLMVTFWIDYFKLPHDLEPYFLLASLLDWNGKLAGSRTTRRWRTQVKGSCFSWRAWSQHQEKSVPLECEDLDNATVRAQSMQCCSTTGSGEDGTCWASINYQQPIKATGGNWTDNGKGQRRDEQEVCWLGGQSWAFAGS